MNPEKVIQDFIQAWDRGDKDAIIEAFTDDAVYHNIPMPPCNGKAAIREFLDTFIGVAAPSVHFEILNQVVSGNMVMNERVDTIPMESGNIELPVMGIFELTDDGKIKGWRDYFDMAQFTGG